MIKSRLTQGLVAIVALLIGLVAAPPAGAVVGGSDAAQGQFPYLVSVVSSGIFGDSHICGGAILDATTVLTAAHCADGGTTSSLKVSYGSANRTAGTKASLNRVIMHPSYSSSTIDNDLAVLKLSSPIPLDGVNAAAIPLAAAGSVASGAVQVAGWGRTAYGAPLPVQAQYAGLNVVDRATCNGRWGGINLITKNMMCAGGANDGLTSCNGDSGGPLVQDQGGTAVLVGIVSWGKFGCTSDYPAVFADVAEPGLRSWINNLSGTAARSAAVTRPAATPLPHRPVPTTAAPSTASASTRPLRTTRTMTRPSSTTRRCTPPAPPSPSRPAPTPRSSTTPASPPSTPPRAPSRWACWASASTCRRTPKPPAPTPR